MKSFKNILFLLLAFIIIISNTPPFMYLVDWAMDLHHYKFSNASGSFTVTNTSTTKMTGINSAFQEYVKIKHPAPKDTVLYRIFSKNPLAFWRWNSYLFDERHKLPYKSWDEIKTDPYFQKNRKQGDYREF
jgi:hypothetical protein